MWPEAGELHAPGFAARTEVVEIMIGTPLSPPGSQVPPSLAELDANSPAVRLLRRATDALRPFQQVSGELHDPVWHEPTQYGTAYFGYVNAVLSALPGAGPDDGPRDAARRGLAATLRHLLNPADPTPTAGFTRDVGTPETLNLRDFMWPAVTRGLALLRAVGDPVTDVLTQDVRRVAAPEVFHERPPSNWSSVWISGEWLRIVAGLSPHGREDVDAWVRPFFQQIEAGLGFYREPGHANSYDLFTRVHLVHLLLDGYDGACRPELEALLVTGLRRSLGVQLSSGSLASVHRSSAHLWNLFAEVSYFHGAATLLRGDDPDLAAEADAAALRAFVAAQQCLRPTGDLSPVENVFPANFRMGYEVYTMEAHYVSLALGFLATAVLGGFTGAGELLTPPAPRVLSEGAPVHRHVVHADGWSVHVNLNPLVDYQTNDPYGLRPDAFGIADVTLGLRRRLRFGGQVHHTSTRTPLTLGVALRRPDSTVHPLSASTPLRNWPAQVRERGLSVEAEVEGDLRYQLDVAIEGDVVRIVEGVDGERASPLVPYLRDRGDGTTTQIGITGGVMTLRSGYERVVVQVDGPVERMIHLPHGYESRHGLIGLVRIDLARAGLVRYNLLRQK